MWQPSFPYCVFEEKKESDYLVNLTPSSNTLYNDMFVK